MVRAAALVSGDGAELQAILDSMYFQEIPDFELVAVISSRRDAYAMKRSLSAGVPAYVVDPELFPNITSHSMAVANKLKDMDIELVILAGYELPLGVIPYQFKNRIIGTFPAMYPAFEDVEGDIQLAVLERGVKMTGAEAMAKAGIATLDTLVSKEGLGMTNGTCAMTSVGALALYDSICAAQLGDVIASLSMEGLTGLRNAFDPRIHQVRGQKGQMLVAANMRKLLAGSEILDNCQSDRVQDAYALRCIPQLHGACRDTLEYVREKVEIELNAVTDNPLMFLDDEAVISGGNFHGEPMALPFDFLGIAASEIADASERRTERMVNPALSNGLTAFLTTQAGVNSGFMIVQYAAASMVSENKVYAHPASVDSIPSSANQEDIVSMGTTAARKAKMILQNTQDVLADELMTACQAIDIRRRLNTHGQGMTPLHEALYQHVREKVAFYEIDREIWPDIRAVEEMIRSGELLDIVKEYIPDFE